MGRTKTRTARRVAPPVSAALDAINAAYRHSFAASELHVSRRDSRPDLARTQSPPAAASHLYPAHPHGRDCLARAGNSPGAEAPFLGSPSNIWRRLPLKHRSISLLVGFLCLYYAVFAKHHSYDRGITAIHADVEDLVRRVNTSMLRENLVEAVLPEIFRESTPMPSLLSSPFVAKHDFVRMKFSDGLVKTGGGMDISQLSPQPKKKRMQMSSEPRKRKEKKKKESKNTLLKDPYAAGGITENTSTINATGTQKVISDLVVSSARAVNASSVDILPRHLAARNMQKIGSSIHRNVTIPEKGVLATPALTAIRSVPGVTDAYPTRTPILDASVRPVAPPALEQIYQSKPGPTSGVLHSAEHPLRVARSQDDQDYSADFKDLGPEDVPVDHVPLLDWNYDAIMDPNTTEQIFGLGNKLDHVAVYKPLCLQTSTGEAISFSGSRICSGFNRTEGWMVQYCDVMKESLVREYLLKVSSEKPIEWLTEKAPLIYWIEGLTILQILEKNCGNIAHFAGRALILQHIIDNIAAYVAPPTRIENIIILPTFHIMKRFLYPHNYDFWHTSVFKALIAPARFTIGTLGNFLYRESKAQFKGVPQVQLLHNFSIEGSIAAGRQYVCFRRVVIPGYLKARFFLDDINYPSKNPSLQSSSPGAPSIPRDSLRFRERVSLVFGGTSKFPAMKKEIVFLDRTGSRRVLNKSTRSQVLDMFEMICKENGYTFRVASFDKMNFTKQYETMNSVAIAIGIHGANLVNSMFMPPLAVLIELFPYGFLHEMYVNGGNSGLKYFKYQMVSGIPFTGLKRYRSVKQCIQYNRDCKVHYRDAVVQVTDADLTAMREIVEQGIAWCNERTKQPSFSAEAKKLGLKPGDADGLLYNGSRKRSSSHGLGASAIL